MTRTSGGAPGMMDEEAVLELAAATAAAERANRPRYLLVGAAGVLSVAAAYAALGARARGAALGDLERERAQAAQLDGLIERIQELTASPDVSRYQPDPRVLEKLENVWAMVAGPEDLRMSEPGDERTGVQGVVKKRYNVKADNQDPEKILQWLAQATDGATVPGLELNKVTLKPGRAGVAGEAGANGWNLDVEFVRWERK